MEKFIIFSDFLEAYGINLDKITFQQAVNMHYDFKKSIEKNLDPLGFVDQDLKEMQSQN